MMDINLIAPKMLWLLPLVLVFIGLHIIRQKRRSHDLKQFAGSSKELNFSSQKRRLFILVLAVLLIIIALARPAWDPQPRSLKRQGRDIAFVLDVSRSMLAEDVAPNRLERAKVAIAECLPTFNNHRVALILFAGSSSIQCPLTTDYDFFLQRLENASPENAAQGGTRIDEALLKVCDKLFTNESQGFRDIILVTDGGNRGNNNKAAIDKINEKNLRLITIGLGDEKTGARIPQENTTSDFLVYKGEEVWTKLESTSLRQLTQSCQHGVFLPVATRNIDLGAIYKRLSEGEKSRDLSEQSVMILDEKFPYFIGMALMLLTLLGLMPHSQKKRRNQAKVLPLLALALWLPANSRANETNDNAEKLNRDLIHYRQINEEMPSVQNSNHLAKVLYRLTRYNDAAEIYQKVLEQSSNTATRLQATYNLANALYLSARNSEDPNTALPLLQQSRSLYRQVLRAQPNAKAAAFNLEVCLRYRTSIQEKVKKQREKQKQLQKALETLRQMLKKNIAAQASNIEIGKNHKTPKKILIEAEQKVLQQSEAILDIIQQTAAKNFGDLPAEANPLYPSQSAMQVATEKERQALELFGPDIKSANEAQTVALSQLEEALKLLPKDAQKDKQKKEDDANSSEDGDADEESDSESGEGQSESDSENNSSELKSDLDNQQLPPPTESPADILKQELQNQQKRQAGKKAGKQKNVDKDW